IVQEDAKQANDLGLNGTPGFVLNGVKIKGAYPQEHFEKVIDALGVG
ncbi:MAG: thioredoxin domain-containing protein, partial [Candidatus Melainabacteria bacterium]|nr:thioredoxin domain-containing protein [Candidatus Melainabacteria bacterium]